MYLKTVHFTSHYVPIKSVKRANNAEGELSLHPIMFLLNRSKSKCKNDTEKPLHPIMFLLNLYEQLIPVIVLKDFTSHYVPIKSILSPITTHTIADFTSHYVPIKSVFLSGYNKFVIALHPIMFLLNPIPI